jgi:hypothetical protein
VTPPRLPDNVGAAPDVQMAIIESDMHHLGEQVEEDRRQAAVRRREDRDRLERVEKAVGAAAVQIARTADSVATLTQTAQAMQGTQSLILKELHRFQGAVRFLRWLLGAGAMFEGVRLYLEHAR